VGSTIARHANLHRAAQAPVFNSHPIDSKKGRAADRNHALSGSIIPRRDRERDEAMVVAVHTTLLP
jgi:hypothetical protein